MPTFFTFDLETGGFDPNTCGITEISAVVVSTKPDWTEPRVTEHFTRYIALEEGLTYTDEALAIQGRTLDDIQEGQDLGSALRDLHRFVSRHFIAPRRCSPWAHNAAFDMSFIRAACDRWTTDMPFNGAFIDSMALFRALRFAGHHDEYSAKLDNMTRAFGITLPEDLRHTAHGDVLATAHSIAHMMHLIQRKPGGQG